MRLTVSRSLAAISLLTLLAGLAAARTRPRYGGTLRVETRAEALAADGPGRKLLFDTLTQVNENGEVVPALAVSWQPQSGDFRRWLFTLRPAVKFHDGSPLTAESVVQSLARTCAHCGWQARVSGDAVVITSEAPMPGLPWELARSAYAISRQDGNGNPDGTGPFRFAAHENGILFLRANDESWQGRPFVDAVEAYENRAIRQQWQDFSVGKADLVELPPELLRSAQQDRMPMTMSQHPVDLLALTVSDQRIADDHLRESIALAVDRLALLNVIFQKQGEATASLLPDALSGYAFLFPTSPNLTRARELRGGQAAPLHLAAETSDPVIRLAAERLALNLRDAGWMVQVVPRASSPNAELTLRLIHLEAGSPAAGLQEMLQQFGGPRSEGAVTPEALYQIESNFLQSHTVIPLLYLPRVYGVSARLRNLELAPDGTPVLANLSLEDAK